MELFILKKVPWILSVCVQSAVQLHFTVASMQGDEEQCGI